MKPIERLALYFKENKIRFSTVEKEVSIANGYLANQVKNQASIGSDILEKICTAYPKLNPVWLLTGNGPQVVEAGNIYFQDPHKKPDTGTSDQDITHLKQMELYQLQIESLLAQVNFLKQEVALQAEMIQMLRRNSNG